MFHMYLLPPIIRVTMEFAGYCKMLVPTYQTSWRHILENITPHMHHWNIPTPHIQSRLLLLYGM